MAGTMVLMCFLGWFSKWCYLKSRSGHDVCAILYALAINGLVLSVLADEFFLTLNGWLKFAILGALVFGWGRSSSAKASTAIKRQPGTRGLGGNSSVQVAT
jgi:hypothetical protein